MVKHKAFVMACCVCMAGISAFGQVRSTTTQRILPKTTTISQVAKPLAPITITTNAAIPPMTLKAVTATTNGKTEVRLRWLVNEGWLPDGKGFNVFKVVGGTKIGPLNPAPIAVDERKLQPAAAAARISTSKAMKLAPVAAAQATAPTTTLLDVLHTARTSMPGVERRTLFSFNKHAPVTLAASSFAQLKTHIGKYSSAKQLGSPMSNVLQSAFDAPELKAYSTKLGLSSEFRKRSLASRFPGATQQRKVIGNELGSARSPLGGVLIPIDSKARSSSVLTPTKTQPISVPTMHTLMATGSNTDDVRNARATLILGALTDANVADGLGLAFTDTTATNGQQAQYVLSFVPASGAPVDVATADLTVGSDPQPQAPTGLDGTQIGVNHVALYWNPAPDAMSQALILPSYRVMRFDAAEPSGVLLSAHPVLKSSIAASDNPNEQVEPLFSYEDNTAPLGPVTYKVTMLDGFGRESATAASVVVNVEDWATPTAVALVKAQLNADKLPQILWTASKSSDAKYRVYRVDVAKVQSPNYKPELVTPDLIDGNRIMAETEGRSLRGVEASLQATSRIPASQVVQSPISKVLQSPTAKANEKVNLHALGLEPYQSIVDTAAPRDHYYRYIVTAAFVRNQRDSEARQSSQIGVPYLTPPQTPAALKGVFEPVPKVFKRVVRHLGKLYQLPASATPLGTAGPIGVGPGPLINKVQTLKMISPAQSRTKMPTSIKTETSLQTSPTAARARSLFKFPVLPTPDYACYAALSWQPVSGPGAPFTYRVYRIPAPSAAASPIRRYSKAIPVTTADKMFTLAMGAGKGVAIDAPPAAKALSLQKPAGTVTTSRAPVLQSVGKPNLITTMVSEKARHYAAAALLVNPPVLVTETSSTSAKDGHMPSPIGQDVDYIVVPKNQWGVEGEPAKVTVHLKPTVAPSIPTLISAMPNPEQPDQVLMTVIASPDAEEVTKYVVLRKPLPDPPAKTRNTKFTSRSAPAVPDTISKASRITAVSTKTAAAGTLRPQTMEIPGVQKLPVSAIPASRMSSQVFSTRDTAQMSALLETLATFQPVPDASLTLMPEPGFVHVLDKSTSPNKHYAYRVIAVNSNNLQSTESGYLEAATRLGSIPAPTIGEAVVTADGVTIPVQGAVAGTLVLERAQTVGGTDTDFIQILGPVSGALTDRTVMKGQTYKYRVRQFSADGLVSAPSRVITAQT